MNQTSPVRVRLLGPPTVEHEGEPIAFDTRKALALLAQLVTDGRALSRASLVAMLWPESDERRGRGALRRTLYALSRALPPGIVAANREQVSLAPGGEIWSDVDQLRRTHRECVELRAPCEASVDRLRAVVDAYRDSFLTGFSLKDSPDFDDWQFFQGQSLQRMHAACLERLVGCLREVGALDLALHYASRWSSLDALDEAASSAVIELLALSGKRSAALRRYESLKGLMASELGGSPSRQMIELAERVRAGEYGEGGARRRWALGAPAAEARAFRRDRHPATILAIRIVPGGGPAESDAWLLSALCGLVLRFGGRIERHAERHVVVVFGRASTRENAPELAVRAAVEARALASRRGRAAAFAICSGAVEVSFEEGSVVTESLRGAAVHEAVRMVSLAKEDEIVVSESTYRSTRRAARYEPVPASTSPRYALRDLRASPAKSRGIEGHRGRLIGRSHEIEELRAFAGRVASGMGGVAVLSGEAGVGKSRLIADVRRLSKRAVDGGPLWLEGRCLDLGVAAGYWPFIDMLRHLLDWDPGGSDEERAAAIARWVERLVEDDRAEVVRHLSILLSAAPRTDTASEDPERIREGVFQAVRRLLLALARTRPVVIVFEDLHWADTPSLDLITHLVDAVGTDSPDATATLGILCVYRPVQDHPCRHLSLMAQRKCPDRFTEITLRELSPADSLALVESLLGSSDLPGDITRTILERGQGNPFFLEELVRVLIETRSIYRERERWLSRSRTLATDVPETVESVVRGTTDLLPAPLQRTLRAASVLGRLFDPTVLARMTDSEDVDEALSLLQDRSLVYEERAVPRREFSFRHVLTRDAVYAGIPDELRREHHQRAAEAIRSIFGDRPDPYLEQLAYHYEAAGEERSAVHYLHEVGRKAIRVNDNEAARAALERALGIVRSWTRGAQRAGAELDILLTLGIPVTATTGYGSEETRRVYQRANDLISADERSLAAFRATYGLWRYCTIRGDVPRALELATQLVEMAEDLDEQSVRLEALRALSCILVHAGRFREAEEPLRRGLAMYRPELHRANAFLYGHDPATTLHGYQAINLWCLGFPDRASEVVRQLRRLMEASSHRLSVAYTHAMGCIVDQLNGRVELVRESCRTAIALCSAGRIPMFRTIAEVLLGWVESVEGSLDRGIEEMATGLAAWESVGGGAFRPYIRCLLADAYGRAGSYERAREVLSHAAKEVRAHGDRWCEPEVYRLQGVMAFLGGSHGEATELLDRATGAAQASGSLSFELRVALSRARSTASSVERDSAREALERIHLRFQEGFTTKDLTDAAALLA